MNWSFEALIEHPNGTAVRVTMTIPSDTADADVLEHAELAGMAVVHGYRAIARVWDYKTKRATEERAEAEGMPF